MEKLFWWELGIYFFHPSLFPLSLFLRFEALHSFSNRAFPPTFFRHHRSPHPLSRPDLATYAEIPSRGNKRANFLSWGLSPAPALGNLSLFARKFSTRTHSLTSLRLPTKAKIPSTEFSGFSPRFKNMNDDGGFFPSCLCISRSIIRCLEFF